MTSRRIRTETCPTCQKGIYRTQEAVIKEILARLRMGAAPLRWYPCPVNPKHMHLTSKKGR